MNTSTDNTKIDVPNTATTKSDEKPIVTTLTSGQQLRQAREAKHLSLEEISKQLSLNKGIIVAIENDDYSKMGAPVYARGYIVAYARLLQIPSEPILKEFKQKNAIFISEGSSPSSPIKILRPIKIHANQEQHGSSWTVYTAIVILLIAISVWVYNYHQNTILKGITLPKTIEPIKTNSIETDNNSTMSNSNMPSAKPNNPTTSYPLPMPVATPDVHADTHANDTHTDTHTNDVQKTPQPTSNIEILPPTDDVDN